MALAIRAGADPGPDLRGDHQQRRQLLDVPEPRARTSWPAITRRSRRSTSSSRISGIVLDYAKKSVFPLPLVGDRTPDVHAGIGGGPRRRGRFGGDQDLPGHRTAGGRRNDTKPLLGCIADDFTGGTDLAGMLVKAGMRTVQMIGVPQRTDPRRHRRGGHRAQVAHEPGRRGDRRIAGRAGLAAAMPAAASSTSSTARPSTRRRRATSARSPRR